ncbi:MAG: AAA family ATPase [Oscillospiraceae bacterium]
MLRDKMLAVMADVNSRIAEREELVETIATALLTRKNLFILGDPGQAKSYAINLFCERITGARQFERLLSKQTDEDQLFGRVDLSSLIPGKVSRQVLDNDATYQTMLEQLTSAQKQIADTPADASGVVDASGYAVRMERYRSILALLHGNEPTVLTTGKIPEADIVFLDEAFKCNDGVLNSLLTALNERKYTNEGRTYPIPTISFFAASNEIPNFNDPQEKILAALYDRLELKIVTENIADRDNRLGVLRQKQSGCTGGTVATITLDELKAMQAEVTAIPVPDAANELADDILCELRKGGITVSDRKYLNYYPIAQAQAWLSGHTEVEAKDLLALRCYLWEKPADRAQVDAVLNRMCINPMQDKVNDIRAMAADVLEDFNASKDAAGSRALIKFRGEYIRLYGMYEVLVQKAESDAEKAMLADLLSDLERDSKTAHDAVNFTYTPLEQLAALNN